MSNQPDFHIKTIYLQLKESALTYRLLAEQAEAEALKHVFEDMAAARTPLANALAHEVAMDGEAMPPSGSIGGIVDRIWLGVRDSVAQPDARAMVEECERAEAHLIEHYDAALAGEPPTHLVGVLTEQRASIAENLERLRLAAPIAGRSEQR